MFSYIHLQACIYSITGKQIVEPICDSHTYVTYE